MTNGSDQRVAASAALGIFICVGLALAGFFVANGVARLRSMDRVVSVRGLAEREMPANIAIWPIQFTDSNDDLVALYAAIQQKAEVIAKFLEQHGLEKSEITVSPPSVRDRSTESSEVQKGPRYTGTAEVTVYSDKIDAVRSAIQETLDLGKLGIVISGGWESEPTYLFTKLNDVKPEMIEEATKNAREAAEKFAKDSGSRLGKIRSANQGLFEIDDRDPSNPHIKRVRVVTTVVYYLAD